MTEKILFSLENCIKCMQVKELIKDRKDIKIITLPHNIDDWREEDFNNTKSYDVFEDLQVTAPVLWVDGKKFVGYLKIRKCLQGN